jgi:L-threonylcarbamoyladenylate synthase
VTDVIRVDPDRPDPSAIATAAACLRRGGLVAFPTETVYGLGVDALNREAVRRLFEAKGRPADDPLIVHVASIESLPPLVAALPEAALALGRRHWPGPLTLVLARSAAVPDEVTARLPTVAVRIPAHPVARALIAAAGVPVAAPSANLFSRPSPTQAAHVLADLGGRIDLIVDGGPTTIGVESTVLDLTTETPTVLRPGAVTIEMLREVLPNVRPHAPARDRGGRQPGVPAPLPSPGMLEKHYSPRAPLTLFEGAGDAVVRSLAAAARDAIAAGKTVGLVVADEDLPALDDLARHPRVRLATLGSASDPAVVAVRLYATLRRLDADGTDLILARGFSEHGLGAAVQDRLRRAAAGRIVRC